MSSKLFIKKKTILSNILNKKFLKIKKKEKSYYIIF